MTAARTAAARPEGYAAAIGGLTEYWYPVLESRRLRGRPKAVKLLDRAVVLIREAGRVHALEDRCPHRGAPLSWGRKLFPGHLTCIYHGWTFDLATGALAAALPDGPASPIVGKACVRTFPVAERCGLIWVWTGEGEAVPVEDDIPAELLRPDARIFAFPRLAHGDWRDACENGFDEAHGKMLHRSSPWVLFRRMAGWNETEIVRSDDGVWLTRFQHAVHEDDDYPGLGRWPRFNFWQRRAKRVAQGSNEHAVSIRLPCTLRVRQPGRAGWTHYEWYVPVERGRYRYLVLAVAWLRGWRRPVWWLRYWTYILWVHHYGFNNQDLRVVPAMRSGGPAPLFRPDESVAAWRRMVEEEARPPGRGGLNRGPAGSRGESG